jgi:hypothetical protein
MGREIKRVAAGFNWPLEEKWPGFINPHWKPCPEEEKTCFGGYTAAGKWLDSICRFLATVGTGCVEYPHREEMRRRGCNAPHPYLTEFPQAPHYGTPKAIHDEAKKFKDDRQRMQFLARNTPNEILPLTDELLEFLMKLSGAERKDFGIGHGAEYKFFKTFKRIAKMGDSFGICSVCKGEGMDPAAKIAYDAWQEEDPPAGDWWQVWETVSEGSPVTPAFATADELVNYLVTSGDAWDQKRGDGGWKREAAEKFVKSGYAPSMMMVTNSEGSKIYEPRDGAPS